MSDCEASIPAITRAGSPGITRTTTNTIDEINKTGDYNDDIAASLKKICDGFAEKGAY